MKIRILGNSLRLRLSQSEVANLAEDMHVSDSINFGGRKLIYALQGADVESISAEYNGDIITVNVPESQIREWTASEQVGFDHRQKLTDNSYLNILVEKDFACLVPRKGEEDLFPNPQEGKHK
ncbi:DUF7009 family protein [Fulvivirga sedimenti]|uniref:Uncharacterized protein n=1 Tax=Fulvivirga sedimenti TaxID=2879465 RepID=A0A9X1HWF0_9BACT|nr:hypothetical protein [Fulvivirga sedimenti]MCA6075252.1 hypothetical protein [Fulvivirga sedimenti]MCA6076429.1 hypothetical protein [Fulvivirga sedimenti]MCA6077557.1 hypothetical protein [Fulvivirga sedimenti]